MTWLTLQPGIKVVPHARQTLHILSSLAVYFRNHDKSKLNFSIIAALHTSFTSLMLDLVLLIRRNDEHPLV